MTTHPIVRFFELLFSTTWRESAVYFSSANKDRFVYGSRRDLSRVTIFVVRAFPLPEKRKSAVKFIPGGYFLGWQMLSFCVSKTTFFKSFFFSFLMKVVQCDQKRHECTRRCNTPSIQCKTRAPLFYGLHTHKLQPRSWQEHSAIPWYLNPVPWRTVLFSSRNFPSRKIPWYLNPVLWSVFFFRWNPVP